MYNMSYLKTKKFLFLSHSRDVLARTLSYRYNVIDISPHSRRKFGVVLTGKENSPPPFPSHCNKKVPVCPSFKVRMLRTIRGGRGSFSIYHLTFGLMGLNRAEFGYTLCRLMKITRFQLFGCTSLEEVWLLQFYRI